MAFILSSCLIISVCIKPPYNYDVIVPIFTNFKGGIRHLAYLRIGHSPYAFVTICVIIVAVEYETVQVETATCAPVLYNTSVASASFAP